MMMSSIQALAKRIAGDKRGSGAVEFAIIAPIMLLIFFGTAELSMGISANRKVTLAARTMSDLVARTNSIDKNELKNVFTASTYIMRPHSTTDFKATISAISFNAQGVASVAWKVDLTWNGSSASLADSSDTSTGTIPPDLKVANTQLIKSDVSYPFKPGSAFFIKTLSMGETFFARPRMDSGTVTYCKTCS